MKYSEDTEIPHDVTALDASSLRAASLIALTGGLAQLTWLTQLNLAYNNLDLLDQACFAALTGGLARLTSLTQLNMENNGHGQLDTARLIALTDCLAQLTAMTQLNLAANDLGLLDAARLTALTTGLAQLTALTQLNLADNNLDQSTQDQLNSIIERNKKLQTTIQNTQQDIDNLSPATDPDFQNSVNAIALKIDELNDIAANIEQQYGGKPLALIEQCSSLELQLALAASDYQSASQAAKTLRSLPLIKILPHMFDQNEHPQFTVFPLVMRACAKKTHSCDTLLALLFHITGASLDKIMTNENKRMFLTQLASMIDPSHTDSNVQSLLSTTLHPDKINYDLPQSTTPIAMQLNKMADDCEKVYFCEAIDTILKEKKRDAHGNPFFANTQDKTSLQTLQTTFTDQQTPLVECMQQLTDYLAPSDNPSLSSTQSQLIEQLTMLLELDSSQDKLTQCRHLCEILTEKYLTDAAIPTADIIESVKR